MQACTLGCTPCMPPIETIMQTVRTAALQQPPLTLADPAGKGGA